MSAFDPKRAFSALFDHLVGGARGTIANHKAQRLGGRRQIDDEIDFDCSTIRSQGAGVGRPGTARAKLTGCFRVL
jgi:hypothetical protein